MAQGTKIGNDLTILGVLSVTGNTYLGLDTLSGGSRVIEAKGSATDIAIEITPKGAGDVQVPSGYELLSLSSRSLINKGYHDINLLGKEASATLKAPGASQDQYVVIYDHATTSFDLIATAASLVFSNGINKNVNDVKLGGPLVGDTLIDGAYKLSLGNSGSKITELEVYATASVTINGVGNTSIAISGTGVLNLQGGASVTSGINISAGGIITVTDGRATPLGLVGAADYSANITANYYTQKIYVDSKIGGKDISTLISNPGSSQNFHVIGWDHSNLKYTLIPQSVGGIISGITDYYADIATLLASQGGQVADALYWVEDASTDGTVTSGWAIYRYKGTVVGDLTDYNKVQEQEALDVTAGIGGSVGAIDNAVLRADVGSGVVQNSAVTIGDNGQISLGVGLASAERVILATSTGGSTSMALQMDSGGALTFRNSSASGFSTTLQAGSGVTSMSFSIFNTSARILGGGEGEFLEILTVGSSTTGVRSGDLHLVTGSASVGNADSGHIFLNLGAKAGTGKVGNIGLFTISVANWQNMEKGLFIGNAIVVPTGDPVGGGFLYVEAGALKYRGSSGTITTIANA